MCLNPLYLNKLGFSVPCGKCFECLQKNAKEWQYRLVKESKNFDKNSMITLTYNDEHLPKDFSVSRRDLQLFLKRLRKQLGNTKIKFFACGEYGSKNKTARPHYHLLIFGYDFEDKTPFCFDKKGTQLYRSRLLEKCWTLGFSSVGEFNSESAIYCAKYLQKLVEHEGRRKPFFQMSKGLGLSALTKDMLVNDKVYIDGKCLPVPRYYLEKLKQEFPFETEELKNKRKNYVLKLTANDELYWQNFEELERRKEKFNKFLKSR